MLAPDPATDPKAALRARYEAKPTLVLKPDRQLGIVRFSPCGSWLVAGGTDGTIRRWRLAGGGGEPVAFPPSAIHRGWVQALAFAPAGGRAYSADSWGRIACWDVTADELALDWTVDAAHDGWVRALAVSADGARLVTCGRDGAVRVWSAADGAKVRDLPGHDADTFAIAFHPDGGSVVSGDQMGRVTLWDLATGRAARGFDAKALHKLDRLQDCGGVRALAFGPGGKTLAVAGTRPKGGATVLGMPTVFLFDAETGKVEQTLSFGDELDCFVYDLLWHPDGFLMGASSGNPGVGKLFLARPGDAAPFFLAPLPNCHSLALHPSGALLAVSATNANSNGNGRNVGKGSDYPGNWSPIHLWSVARPNES